MLLNFKSSKLKHLVYSSLKNTSLLRIERLLANTKTHSQNLDTHRPEQIQHKWYELWQNKLKEFNQQVMI